jgi:hypothetical protein
MKIPYKWPNISQTSGQQTLFMNKKTKQEVSTNDQTLGIGIATIIFYFLMIFYIYISGAINQNGIKTFSDFLDKIKDFRPSKLNTLSSSFEFSEKIGTTICLIVFLALLQGIFSFQNIYSNDFKRAPIIAFNYVIILCWLLFMFIFPSKIVNSTIKTSSIHFFLAFCVLTAIIINCFLVSNLYSEYFELKDLEPLNGIGYALVGLVLFAGITMIFNTLSDIDKFNWILKYTHSGVAYAELCCLILFGVFMVIFIQLPPLPSDQQLSCVMVPVP